MPFSRQVCQSMRSQIRLKLSPSSAKTCNNMQSSSSSLPKKSVCVVGGGFGGLYTALKLEELTRQHRNLDITLIDKKEKFVFLPLLYELTVGAAELSEVAPLYSDLLRNSKVKFQRGTVTNIDFKDNKVHMIKESSFEKTINYDYLVLTPGAQPRLDMIPGAREHAIPFYQAENAYSLRNKLEKLVASDKSLIHVAVVGGYSGVEIATNVAEYLGKARGNVILVDRNSQLLASSPKHNRKTAKRCLDAAGVSVLLNKSVEKIQENQITLSERTDGKIVHEFDIPIDVVIVTSGTEPNPLITALNLEKSTFGKILIDKNLKVKGMTNVYASGDCAQIDQVLLPSTAQVAMQQAQVLAKNIAIEYTSSSSSSTVKLEEFQYTSLGEMLTLGFKEATITGFGGLVQIDGPTAAFARRFAYAMRMPTPTQTINALLYAGIGTASKLAASLRDDVRTSNR